MSKTVSRGQEARQQAEVVRAGAPPGRTRSRGRLVALGIVVVVAAGAVAAWRAGAFSPAGSPPEPGQQGAPPPATQPVVREDLSATTPVTATLGYAGPYPVTGQGGGTLTWLPSPGQVIGQGQVLYQTGNGSPGGAAVRQCAGLAEPGRGRDRGGRVPAQPRPGGARLREPRGYRRRSAGTTTRGRRRRRCRSWKGTWGSPARPGRCRWGRWCSSRRRCGSAR